MNYREKEINRIAFNRYTIRSRWNLNYWGGPEDDYLVACKIVDKTEKELGAYYQEEACG